VGTYLHYSHSRSGNYTVSPKQLQEYLAEVSSEIEEVLKGNILGGWLGETFQFECKNCSQLIVYGKQALEKSGHIVCQNPNCRAEYFGSLSEDRSSATFQLKVTKFDCAQCGREIQVENRHIKIGLEFACPSCSIKHRIENKQWGYSAELEEDEKKLTKPLTRTHLSRAQRAKNAPVTAGVIHH